MADLRSEGRRFYPFCPECGSPMQVIRIEPGSWESEYDRNTGERNYRSVNVCTNTDRRVRRYLFGLIRRLVWACNSEKNWRRYEKRISRDVDLLSTILDEEVRKLTKGL